MYLRDAEHRELYLSGLRLAAGEAASWADSTADKVFRV